MHACMEDDDDGRQSITGNGNAKIARLFIDIYITSAIYESPSGVQTTKNEGECNL